MKFEIKVLRGYKIEDCPFCGGGSELINRNYCIGSRPIDEHDEFYGQCKECRATGKMVEIINGRCQKDSEGKLERAAKEAAKYWNRRTCSCGKKENCGCD